MGTVIRIRRHILSASELLARLTRKVISNIGHVLTYGLCCLCSLATYGRIGGPLKGFVRSGHLVFLTGWVRQCAGAVQERDYTNLNCCGMFRTLKGCGDIAARRHFCNAQSIFLVIFIVLAFSAIILLSYRGLEVPRSEVRVH